MSPFAADNVGSFLRPDYLLDARRHNLHPDHLRPLEDRAVLEVLQLQEEVSLSVVTDGEFRRKLFFSTVVEVTDGFDPVGFERFHRDAGGNVERFGVPTPVRKLTRKAWLTDTEFQFVKEHTDRPIKITMPSPSMFLNYWTHGRSDLAYSTQEAFLDDLIAIMNDDAKALAAAGATYLQIDAPQYTYLGDPAVRPDVKDPATELRRLLANDRRVLEGVSGIVSGLHLCRGNYVPIERLALSTQCGFASVDEGNAITRDAQRAKLELVVRTAERVWGGIPAKPRRP